MPPPPTGPPSFLSAQKHSVVSLSSSSDRNAVVSVSSFAKRSTTKGLRETEYTAETFFSSSSVDTRDKTTTHISSLFGTHFGKSTATSSKTQKGGGVFEHRAREEEREFLPAKSRKLERLLLLSSGGQQRAKEMNPAAAHASSASAPKGGVDPTQVPVIVMYSVGKAEESIRNSEFEKAKKMMESTDQLCVRYGAPPPVHGLALRILADAYEQCVRMEGTSDADRKRGIEDAKKCLRKGLDLCAPHFGAKGLPKQLEGDLYGRAGDLHNALAELHRKEEEYIDALKHFREAVKKFSKLDSKDFQAASANRLAFTFMNMNEWTDALKELKMAEELEQKLDSRSEILSSTYNFKGKCLAEVGDKEEAKKAFAEALKHALACGNEPVKEEASKYLEEHGYAEEKMAPDAYI